MHSSHSNYDQEKLDISLFFESITSYSHLLQIIYYLIFTAVFILLKDCLCCLCKRKRP